MKPQDSTLLPQRQRRTNSLTKKYSWRFLKAAWLFAFAAAVAVAFTIIESNWLYDYGYLISPIFHLTLSFYYTSYVVAGMMLTQLLRPSRNIASSAVAIACVGVVAYIIHNYIHLGIGAIARSFGIYNVDIIHLFFVIESICFGVFIQSRLGSGLYKGRISRAALVITIVATTLYILNGFIYSRGYYRMGKLALQTVESIQFLADIVLPIAIAILLRSKTSYKLTRPVIVKLVLVVLILISLSEVRRTWFFHSISRSTFLITYLIALVICVPPLVRSLIKGLREI